MGAGAADAGLSEPVRRGCAQARKSADRQRVNRRRTFMSGLYSPVLPAASSAGRASSVEEGDNAADKTFVIHCFDSFGNPCHQTSAGWQGDKRVYSGEATRELLLTSWCRRTALP